MPFAETISGSSSLIDDIRLHEDDLTEEAKHQFTFHNEILHAFQVNRRSILNNDQMTPIGRHLAFSALEYMHAEGKKVLNYMAKHNELTQEKLPDIGPLVICGLPRTGSTLLYNLLACDPNCRAPSYTDMCVESVPPISRSNFTEHQRREKVEKVDEEMRQNIVQRRNIVPESHPKFAIEEDLNILKQAGLIIPFAVISSEHQVEPVAWTYDKSNKDFAYAYHKTFLTMLNTVDRPYSHWLLKSPLHSFFLDTFFRHYPQALMIMTHRNLDEVFPSCCKMMWAFLNIYFDENNSLVRTTCAQRTLWHVYTMIERIMEFRTRPHQSSNHSSKDIFDVIYDDLMKEPIATVRRIYDHFNLQWSQEFEGAMNVWLRENPQGKQGRHTYSLAEYGFDRDDIEARFADYINLFLRRRSSDYLHSDRVLSTSDEVKRD